MTKQQKYDVMSE